MSDFSKSFVKILSHIIIKAVVHGEECDDEVIEELATMMDEAIGNKSESVPVAKSESTKAVSGKQKYDPGEVPSGLCPFVLTRVPNKGKCCSLKIKEGSQYCTRHAKMEESEESKTTTTTKTKIVKATAQSTVEVAKPNFTFNTPARNFKSLTPAAKTATESKEPAATNKGIFAKRAAGLPSFSGRKKANFYSRPFQYPEDENGEKPDDMTFFFTDDPIAKNLVFLEDGDTRMVAGILENESDGVNQADEPLPEDFLESVNGEYQQLLTDEQREWCTKNRVSI